MPAPGLRRLPILLLFVGSGLAALIYEIVWFQMLQLVVGSSTVSMGVLLGTFMGGMCVGSLCLRASVSPRWHPLRVYAVLEAAIGMYGPAAARAHSARSDGCTRPGRATARLGFILRGLGRGCLSAAADARHGRDAARHRAMGREHATRHVVARAVLRRQHRRGGRWRGAGGLLSAARLRRHRDDEQYVDGGGGCRPGASARWSCYRWSQMWPLADQRSRSTSDQRLQHLRINLLQQVRLGASCRTRWSP